ncbi:MAG: hypothetical protein WD207_03455 [Xanthobacteraceae bacterium]
MRFRSALIGAALAALSITSASGEIRIKHDPGGLIYNHMNAFAQARDAGENVVIDGRCFSSCTLVLGIIPPDRICVTSRALLGFHAAWTFGDDGRPVPSAEGTAAMWTVYPPSVRRWLASKGGLSSKVIVLRGRELTSMYRTCP